MALHAFLYLPDSEGDIDFCENEYSFHLFINQIVTLIRRVKEETSVNLYYDRENISTFFKLSSALLGEKYLSNPKEQIRYILGKQCIDIRTQPRRTRGCLYIWWHYHKIPSVSYAPDLLAEITERYLLYSADNYLLLNETNLQPCRDSFLLFKDDIKSQPSNFIHLPFVTDSVELELWLKTNHIQKFSLFNRDRFKRVGGVVQGKPVFLEIKAKRYWYLDNLHRDEYEVFNDKREHIGTANLDGDLNLDKAVKGRTFIV